MLEKVYYGNTLEDWGISLLIIVGVLLLNKGIVLLNKYVLQRIAAKSKNKIDDILFRTLEKPVLLGLILAAFWVAFGRLNLGEEIHAIIAKSYRMLIVLNATWFIARFVISFVEEYAVHEKEPSKGKVYFDNRLLPLLKRGLLILIWVIGIVMALNNVGVKVTTLLGTLGIGGIAFALAAQDTIKNIFGGITIFTDHPFRIGDIIKFDSVEGTVIDIGIRSTRIRTYEKRLVTVPNYKIMDASITNITQEPARRVVMKLGLTYGTDHNKMKEALDMLKKMPEVIKEVRTTDLTAIFSDFGDSALIITYTYFIRKSANIKETTSAVNFEILRSFNEAGLDFAFPTQTIYLENAGN